MTPAAWFIRDGRLHIQQEDQTVQIEKRVWMGLVLFILQTMGDEKC